MGKEAGMRVPEGYYAVLFREPESKTIGVRFPALPGVITYGRDWEEAEEMAREALNAALETDFDRNLKLPPPGRKPRARQGERVVFVRLDPEVRMAYLLRWWREQKGLTQRAVARRMGVTYQAYQRMERPGRSNLTVSTLERVAEALGGRLVIELR
jgi:predicted RNase H-like HicB family nuclease/DNA-binding XRE family transcriptional regulator